MSHYENRLRVDTFHPSVNVVLTTRNSNDVVVYDTVKRNRVSFPIANTIQGSDVLKVAYMHVSRLVLPVSWFNVDENSYLILDWDDGTLIGSWKVSVHPDYWGQWTLDIFKSYIEDNSDTGIWVFTKIDNALADAPNSNLPLALSDLQNGRVGISVRAADGWPDGHTLATNASITTSDDLFGNLATSSILGYLGFRRNTTYTVVWDDILVGDYCLDVKPYKVLRIQASSIPQNTPVTSSFLPNALETIPVEANFGETIVFEPTNAFRMMIPQLIISQIDIQILDEYGKDVNFRGGDWSLSLIIDFESRSVDPPVGNLVMPRERSTNPMDNYRKRVAEFNEGDEEYINPLKAIRTFAAPSQGK